MPAKPMYLNSWVRIPVKIPVGFVDFDDLRFLVDPPTTGCQVSRSRDDTFDPSAPDVILIAGGLVGDYRLRALDRATGDEVMTGDFSVTDVWAGRHGPPICVTGRPDNQQDVVFAATGVRPVAVVILETSDFTALSTAAAAQLRQKLQRELFGGVTPTGEFLESTNAYFSEISLGRFELENAGVVGPVRLSKKWLDYGPEDPDRGFNFWNGLREFSIAGAAEILRQNEELAAAGRDPLVDLTTVQSILFIMRSLPPTGTEERGPTQWPWASGAGYPLPDFQVGTDGTGMPITRRIEVVAMPDDWEEIDSTGWGRKFRHTMAHELGHNLGLADQYGSTLPTGMADRDVEEYSLMSKDLSFPQLTSEERLALGWADPSMIVDVGSGPVDRAVTLRAASLGEPGAGQFLAARVTKSSTVSYLFEYRAKRDGRISDQRHPVEEAVFGLESTANMVGTANRPRVMRLRNDRDGDRGVFVTGGDYLEEDTINPEFPVDLRVDVLDAADNTARVRIRFGDRKPDPAITPFSRETGWKSPDLEVVNDRSTTDPVWRDTPWNDHPNWILARVRNDGDLDAREVKVEFYVKDLTLSADAPEQLLGWDTRTVPSGHSTTFKSPTSFRPTATPFFSEHYCVGARILPYSVPGQPALVESDPGNNWAQSNHARFMSGIFSPASRERVALTVHGTDRRCRHHIRVEQSSPVARTYLDHAWISVEPGETRKVEALTEFLVGDDSFNEFVDGHGGIEPALREPNTTVLTESISTGCSGSQRGGASLTVHLGRRTEFAEFDVKPGGSFVFGRVVLAGTNQGVDGTVLVTVHPVDTLEEEVSASGDVSAGDFSLQLGHGFSGTLVFRAEFLHTAGLTSCRSDDVIVDV